jgi:DNA-binding response OmpR family regulator
VVDDDERVRGLLHRALEDGMPGCVVEEAEDGLAAQAKIPAFRPHLLVLDLCMPRLDGAELCRWVKTSGSPETKVVILTANTDAGLLGRALEAGAEAWMPKPSSLPALLAKIRGLLAP